MTRAIILGAGMVGSTMARDLASDPAYEVTVADIRPDVLARLAESPDIQTVEADLSDPAVVKKLVSDYDIVLGALASVLGLQTLRAVIEAERNYCDISFMAEDATQLHELAVKHGVTAVVDCGVAPGISNMMAGYGAAQLDVCENIEIYVGGLPVIRRWPFSYKATFAPFDVLEEYTRPSRIVKDGAIVIRPALSDPELLDFPGVGTLEAFNTDGLRSLVDTLDVPNMLEKTLRYPGHIELMRVLRETGFFSKETIQIGDATVRPLDVTAALMFPKWTFDEGEADLTIMRVVTQGQKDGQTTTLSWDLLDYYDAETRTRSMPRTTGFPATIMARFIQEGRFRQPGVFPPEIPAKVPGVFDAMLQELANRGVHYTFTQQTA